MSDHRTSYLTNSRIRTDHDSITTEGSYTDDNKNTSTVNSIDFNAFICQPYSNITITNL